MNCETPRYSVVIPVFGNEGTLAEVTTELSELAARLSGSLEAVFVVDGSPDGSLLLLRRLLAENTGFTAQLVALSRNFGSFSAIRTGLAAAEGEFIAVMAADLQEPISLVESFFERLESGDYDVAVGVRTSRSDPPLSMALSRTFWQVFRRFVHAELPKAGVDVFACSRPVALELTRLEESHTSLVGLLYWLGFRRAEVPYVRGGRTVGKSGWGLRRKVRYLLDSVFSFTDIPITLISVIGLAGMAVSVTVGLVVLIAWLAGQVEVAGYTPLMLTFAFFASCMLLSLGIIGSYVWRTYENTKARPDAIAMSRERFAYEGRPESQPPLATSRSNSS